MAPPEETKLTYGALRAAIAQEKLPWQPDPEAPPDALVHRFSLGGDPANLPTSEATKAVNFKRILEPGANPFLAARRLERGLVSAKSVAERFPDSTLVEVGLRPPDEDAADLPSGGTAAFIDWRNRWGRNWITSIRDQGPCAACWAFAGTALVEAMVRIEDSMWVRLSEGDIHRGVGSPCINGNNMGTVSDFFRDHGLCDPGCFPWATNDPPYTPTPDRSGRTVKGPAFTWVNTGDAKNWIDTVGPVVTWFDVYDDFFAFRTGVYRRSTAPTNIERGGHFMLVIGYSDSLGAWLCKNSWGAANWGVGGFGWVGYGESGIDQYAKAGLRNTNPDPWTKRRLHNGALYESGNGAMNRNLEVMGSNGSRVQHRWREGGPPWTWGVAKTFATDAAVCPTLVGTTFNRNMEVVYLTTNSRLHHWWGPGGGSGPWNDGGVFGPTDCRGVPGFVQGDYNAPGNFEVVVLVGGGQLQHVWRDGGGWHNGPKFGANVAYSGASLVQGDYGAPHGNLEVVATLNGGAMQHFWRRESDFSWHPGAVFGAGASGPPVMIQGQYGMFDEAGPHGNFELCVATGGRVQHWWRNNAGGSMAWIQGPTFGHDILAVAGLAEGQWGMNLELIVLRTDQQLQHYWRDGGFVWHEGPVIGPA